MFSKSEKKKKTPYVAAGIGALAAFGAYSMFKAAKQYCVGTTNKMCGMFKSKASACCGSADKSGAESCSEEC